MNATRRVVHLRVPARAAIAAAGVMLTLGACTLTNPPQTTIPFNPGDGINGQIGGTDRNSGILLRNFLVVASAQGRPGAVAGAISNRTNQDAQVQLAVVTGTGGQQQAVAQTTVQVGAGQFVQVGSLTGATASAPRTSIGAEPAAGQTVSFDIPSVPVPPGAVLQLFARTASLGGTRFDVPVLPAVGDYAQLVPTASASASASAGGSAGGSVTPSTATPTGSVHPSANPSGAAKQTANPSESAPAPSGSAR